MRRRASRWQYCSAQTHPSDVGEDRERERERYDLVCIRIDLPIRNLESLGNKGRE